MRGTMCVENERKNYSVLANKILDKEMVLKWVVLVSEFYCRLAYLVSENLLQFDFFFNKD